MFHISFLVRDKHLADTLRSLENRAIDLDVRPAKVSAKDNDEGGGKAIKHSGAYVNTIVQTWIDTGAPFTADEVSENEGISTSAIYKRLTAQLRDGTVVRYKKGKGYIYVKPTTTLEAIA